MWDYTEKVKDHFYNPRNAGAVADANAVGEVGSISCGDALRLTLKVDPADERILDAGFQTFGCGSAIASSSALTEIIRGMTLDDALKVTNQDIADFLEGLPPEKMHCSVMGREALAAAVANYRGETWVDDHEEGDLVCKCFAVDAVMIENVVRENKLSSVAEVTNYTKAGGSCASCHEKIEDILSTVMAERGEVFQAAGKAAPAAPAKSNGLSNLERIRLIEKTIAELRPQLQADHGDIELMDVEGKTITVRLTGACTGCQLAGATLGGVQQRLIEALGEFVRVVPAQAAHSAAGA
ncbi:Fe-S cluster assembly protein NifU [Acidihalobacter aeolianus]|uniref:Nitrogen fixation protein NifU n=1 Tax=Acidihalobacter aeolianus TaxID=2792603 RepID=A0A1D8K9Z3_9GAMM|nr:Fe-S cluster assembly protein NifU [Acidihalobacter aeolianus]AOV17780.1 Fe-S cluster assembly protein NifU [Acidihalobacter aeolianus]